MKTNTIARIVMLAGIMALPACGMKVGVDGETIDAVECAFDKDCASSNSEDSTASDQPAEDAEGNASGAEAVSYQGTRETDQETNGGIGLMEPDGYSRTSDRLFLGTFKSDPSYYYGASCFTLYNLPSIVRAYSHLADPFIDFETNKGDLAWVARLYEDDTFDFSVNFLDKFGHPSVDLDCTCEIADSYYDYYPQKIQCACVGDQGSCPLYYEMM